MHNINFRKLTWGGGGGGKAEGSPGAPNTLAPILKAIILPTVLLLSVFLCDVARAGRLLCVKGSLQ
jgi:hypothetical protein